VAEDVGAEDFAERRGFVTVGDAVGWGWWDSVAEWLSRFERALRLGDEPDSRDFVTRPCYGVFPVRQNQPDGV